MCVTADMEQTNTTISRQHATLERQNVVPDRNRWIPPHNRKKDEEKKYLEKENKNLGGRNAIAVKAGPGRLLFQIKGKKTKCKYQRIPPYSEAIDFHLSINVLW